MGPCTVPRSSWPGLAGFYSSGSGPGESRSGWGWGRGRQAPLQQQPHIWVPGSGGGWRWWGRGEGTPIFSRGQCKGVQSGPGPQLLTLDRWEAGGRAMASLLEDGVRVGTEGCSLRFRCLGHPPPPRQTPSEEGTPARSRSCVSGWKQPQVGQRRSLSGSNWTWAAPHLTPGHTSPSLIPHSVGEETEAERERALLGSHGQCGAGWASGSRTAGARAYAL